MNTIRIDKKQAKMVAHRGVSKLETENTLAAFIAAGNRSYWGIETDVWRTADGQFILLHDGNTKRLSGFDANVEDLDLAALREIPLYDLDKKSRRSDLRLVTLKEYIRICKKYEKISVVELKSKFTEEEIKRIIRDIEEEDALKTTVFISFIRENMLLIRRLLPDQPCQQLADQMSEELFAFIKEHRLSVDVGKNGIDAEWIRKIHGEGLEVNVWTVDQEQKADELIAAGADYLTTNILE